MLPWAWQEVKGEQLMRQTTANWKVCCVVWRRCCPAHTGYEVSYHVDGVVEWPC